MDPIVEISLVLSFAALFISAAFHKFKAPIEFRQQLQEYKLLPQSLIAIAATAIPIAESATALTLVLPPTRQVGFSCVIGLLLIYAFAMAINIQRGRRDIECGCSGPAQKQPLSIALIVRNVFLAMFAGLALMPVSVRPLNAGDYLTITMVLCLSMLLYATTNQLIANRSLAREMALR